MSRIVFSLVFVLLFGLNAISQKTYFVYLQTEKQEPFYVQINNKSISSSPEGYIILPKLTDGTYSIKLGFPRNSEVQNYDLYVNGNDAGYLVKQTGDNWGITDLQTGSVQLSGVELGKKEAVASATRLEEEKRIADSTQASQALLEQKRRADSLLAAEFKKKEDSVKAASVVLEMPKETSASSTAAENITEKSAATATEHALEKSGEAATVAASAVVAAAVVHNGQQVDSAASSSFKSEMAEPEKKTAITPEISTEEQKRIADSLQMVAEKHRADSIRLDETNREAQKKIEEAREIMRKTLGQTAATGAVVGAAATGEAVKKESENSTSETPVKKQEEPVVSEKQNAVAPKTTTPEVLVPAIAVPTTKPTSNKPTTSSNDPKFLDMDMGAEVSEPTKKTDVKKAGLSSNNANTKIIEGGAVTGAAIASDAAAKNASGEKSKTALNGNCKDEASEKDFFNLRKKMAADDDPDEMLNTARKAFKEKCYSTFQVKNLCVLFLTDANKYRFLDIAYMHATDPKKFNSLVNLLSDDYYIRRFNAMIAE